jgi:hypothetical protein
MLLRPIPLIYRRRAGAVKRREGPPGPPPPPVALTLVAAELTVDPENNAFVRLSFDRAIDVGGLVASQITVDDEPGAGWAYAGTGVSSIPDPQSIIIALVITVPASGDTRLNATSATGIVAVDDGGTWAGASDLPLPYP